MAYDLEYQSRLRARMLEIIDLAPLGILGYNDKVGVLYINDGGDISLIGQENIQITLGSKLLQVEIKQTVDYSGVGRQAAFLHFPEYFPVRAFTVTETSTVAGKTIWQTGKNDIGILYYEDDKLIKYDIDKSIFIIEDTCYDIHFNDLFKAKSPHIIKKPNTLLFNSDNMVILHGGQILWDATYDQETHIFKLNKHEDPYYLIEDINRIRLINYNTGGDLCINAYNLANYKVSFSIKDNKIFFSNQYADASHFKVDSLLYCFKGIYIAEIECGIFIRIYSAYVAAPTRTKAAIRQAEPEDDDSAANAIY